MYDSKQSNLSRLRIVIGMALVLLTTNLWISSTWLFPSAKAQSVSNPGTITVVGEGKVTLEPDIARANIGVEVLSKTVAEASAEGKMLIESIIAVLKEEGIAEKDIQTSGFNIFAERYGPAGPRSEDEVQYRVNNMVAVAIRDLERVGDILDAAIEAGANSIHGVNFQVEDPSSVESNARKKAVEDAFAKAEELAVLTGVGVGNVVSISEVVGGNGGFYQTNFNTVESAALGGGGGFSPGELSLVMRLQITYAIVPAQATGPIPENQETTIVAETKGEHMTLFVAPETVDCVGVAPQTCMQVKFSPDEEWTLFYDQIEGFEYEPGFGYELLVSVVEIENPPADGSSLRYMLVELIAKRDVTTESAQ